MLVLKHYQALAKTGYGGDANQLLEAWLEQHPNDTKVHLALAQAYQQSNRDQRATAHYAHALKLDKNNPVLLNNLAWLYHKQNDPRALSYAEQAYKAAPNNGLIADTLGWLYVQNGKAQQGLELLQQAFKQAPATPDIHYHLAAALATTGQTEKARKELTKLLAAGKRFPDRQAAESLLKALQ